MTGPSCAHVEDRQPRPVLPPAANLWSQCDRDAYVICHDVLTSEIVLLLVKGSWHMVASHRL
jgi:hypothetical protein